MCFSCHPNTSTRVHPPKTYTSYHFKCGVVLSMYCHVVLSRCVVVVRIHNITTAYLFSQPTEQYYIGLLCTGPKYFMYTYFFFIGTAKKKTRKEGRKGRKGRKRRKALPIRAVYVRCFLLYGLGSRVFLFTSFYSCPIRVEFTFSQTHTLTYT